MCGFAGFIDTGRAASAESLSDCVGRMAGTLAYRGPDDSGTWVDPEAGVALGHRRLSIIDLSEHGHQPMVSHSGRYVVAYNGELYNYPAVRAELAALGHRFTGHSDTEVLLTAVDQWGLSTAVRRFVGMFAFALWDRQARELHLVRDRIGEKPLYYGWQNGTLLFGSELKALREHPDWEGEISREGLVLYLRFGYVPSPYSIHRGVHKLTPGSILSVAATSPAAGTDPVPYWSLREVAERGVRHPFPGNRQEAADQLEELLLSAVGQQMVADVPLGAFLSGGIDSSTIVALMQAQSSQPVRTFTIGFHVPGYNEAEHASAVARHLGTAHTELYVTPKEALEVVPLLPQMYDEPFSDSSQIPTHLVSQLARQQVTVSLSGDGGDELFGGYTRYFLGQRLWRALPRIPAPIRRGAAAGLSRVGVAGWNALGSVAGRLIGEQRVPPRFGEKVAKVAAVMASYSPETVYKTLVSASAAPETLVVGAAEPPIPIDLRDSWPEVGDLTQRMMYMDALTYLPDDILVKVDRASMACSLESRAPFLDHRVVEFAWSLPAEMKVAGGEGKHVLRQVLYRHVPREIMDRPKMGFGVPVAQWLRGPLRPWAEALMAEDRLRQEGFFEVSAVRQVWAEHQSGQHDRQFVVWAILMFQAWLESARQDLAPQAATRSAAVG
jgi:asparagine synthase (glutamine-hydrolysing)